MENVRIMSPKENVQYLIDILYIHCKYIDYI